MATVINPKTGEESNDYALALEARALQRPEGREEAELLFRVASEFEEQLPPEQQKRLLTAAVTQCSFHRRAWLGLARAAAKNGITMAEAAERWAQLSRHCQEFPDLTLDLLTGFARVYKTAPEQYKFYEAVAPLYLQQKRIDLVARLRLAELEMCLRFERKDLALALAAKAAEECIGEGAQGADLAVRCAKLALELKQARTAIGPLRNALSRMVKERAGEVNPYYLMVGEALAELYRSIGDLQAARAVESQMPGASARK